MEVINYCLNDFDICEKHYNNFFKAKNKNDSQFYYIKKYNNQKLEKEKFESLKKKMFELSIISNFKFFGLFEEVKGEEKDIYLIFEFFDGKLVCNNNDFQYYEIWAIADKLLEIFEKLSKEGIKFHKNNSIDVFEINLNELKINIFDLINSNIDDKNENNEILYNIGVILEKIMNKNCFFKGFINDLKNNKIDILAAKTQFKQFLRYSLYFDNTNDEIINFKGMIYSGSLKEGKPNGIGFLVNEYGLFYQGEFKEGEIDGKGKIFIYNRKDESKNKKEKANKEFSKQSKTINNLNDLINEINLIKILEGTFTKGIKNGKFIEYNKNNSKIFEGEFKDDKKNGLGIEFRNGNIIFEGEFKDDIKNGKGIEYINTKKIFEGEFKEGKRNGKGILYNSQSIKIYEGNFENNYFNGNGALYYDDGKILYQGKFKNGIFWENGFYYDILGEKVKITNGLPDKHFKIYNNSGKLHYYLSTNKAKIEGKEYYENGTIKYNGTFKIINIINMMEIDKNKLEKLKDKNEYNCIIKDGHGTSYDNNGKKVYQGEFKLDSYNGKGKLFEYNICTDTLFKLYEGSFLDGKFTGDGIKYFHFKNSKEYEGQFKNGKYEGNGIKYKTNGEQEFKGIFKNGNFYSGFQNISESVDYVGDIINGLKEGKGKKYINKKLRFEGVFKNDIFVEGIVYTINNKKFFEGKINDNNKKEGKFFNEDNIFEGKFEDFCNIADYIIDFTNKCEIIYEGEYKNGMKCGKGKDYLTGYEGEFLYGMYHGKGKNINNNIEGEYKNGKKTGYWKEEKFEGEYKDGLRNGEGKEDSWLGYYVNNCLHGIRMKDYQIKEYYFGEEINILNLRIEKNCIYFKNIKEYEGDIVNGVKEGKGTEFYKNKNKRYEGYFKNGNHHGNGKEYYDNGKIKYEGEFNNNKYDIKGIEYDENGQIIYDGEFKNGKYHGKGKLYRNGKIIYEGDFVDDKLQGKGIEFDKDGKVFYSGEFKNNAFNGSGARYFIKPYEGFWTNNHPDKLKQGLLYIGKYLKLA